MVVSRINAGIFSMSTARNARISAVALSVMPRFIRLYSIMPRHKNEMIIAINGFWMSAKFFTLVQKEQNIG